MDTGDESRLISCSGYVDLSSAEGDLDTSLIAKGAFYGADAWAQIKSGNVGYQGWEACLKAL